MLQKEIKATMKKTMMFLLCFVMILGMFMGFTRKDAHASYKRYTTTSVNVRKSPSTSSAVVVTASKGVSYTCYGTVGNWTKIKRNGYYRYIYTKYLSSKKPSTTSSSSSSSSSSKGQQVVNYAKQFLGNPYVYGGNSLTRGTDCSGFTKLIYQKFGKTIPRNSTSQRSAGKSVSWSNKKAGDLICYYGHVAIYMGNNKVIHASSAKTGIKTTSPANYRSVACVRRIVE